MPDMEEGGDEIEIRGVGGDWRWNINTDYLTYRLLYCYLRMIFGWDDKMVTW